jgi:hypothetical protein
VRLVVSGLGRSDSSEEAEQLARDRAHQRGVPLGGHLDHRLEQPQLQCRRALRHGLGRLREFSEAGSIAVGGDDASASFSFSLGVAAHRPLHDVGQEDILDLSQRAIPSWWGTDLPTTGKRPLTLSSDPER